MKVRTTAISLDKDNHEPGIVISTDHARQGETGGHMRGVLGISTGLAIVAMGAFLILYAVF